MDETSIWVIWIGIGIGLIVNLGADWLPARLWADASDQMSSGDRRVRWLVVEAIAVALVLYSHLVSGPASPLLQMNAASGGGWVQDVFLYFYSALFLLIAVIDLEHRKVPNVLIGAVFVFAVGTALLLEPQMAVSMTLGGVTGFGLFALIASFRAGAMGAGDVKLAGLIGSIVGFPYVLVALAIGIVAGGLGTLLLLLSRRIGWHDSLAYAPFLCIGALVTLWHGAEIIAWYSQRLA